MKEYRVVRYYNTFFAQPAFKLQVKRKGLLGKERWVTVENDSLGLNGDAWVSAFAARKVDRCTESQARGWGTWEEDDAALQGEQT